MTCAFLALLAWIPLPLGSKYPWAISVAEVWCYLIAIIAVIDLIRNPRALSPAMKAAALPGLLLLLNMIWLGTQCIPMPISWLQSVSPSAASVYAQAGLSFATISLDCSATSYQLQTAAFLFTFFYLTIYLIDSKIKLTWMVYTILTSALIQAIYGALMMLSGVEYAFFISKAALHSHIGSATGTFTNRDHLAGYLEMALALGVGYMLSMLSNRTEGGHWKHKIRLWTNLLLGPKARLRLLLIILCLGLVLTHSRGGNIGFFASLGIAGLLFLWLARKKPRATVLFLTSLIILDIVIIGSWVGLSKVVNRLEQTSMQTEQRDDADLATLPMSRDYLFTGSGAGTYFSVFPAYKSPQLPGYWDHAHNDYLELLSEQGLAGFSLLAGVVLYSLLLALQNLRKRRSSFASGMNFAAIMGIFALLIHSTVDFNLHILANSSMFMIILAIPIICRHRQRDGQHRSGQQIYEPNRSEHAMANMHGLFHVNSRAE